MKMGIKLWDPALMRHVDQTTGSGEMKYLNWIVDRHALDYQLSKENINPNKLTDPTSKGP